MWRALNIPLINCEVELILTWSKNRILADMTPRDVKGATFKRKETKLFDPIVTLSKENDIN